MKAPTRTKATIVVRLKGEKIHSFRTTESEIERLFRFTSTDCSWEITNANPRKAISVPIVNTSELTLSVAIAKPWAAPNAADAATATSTQGTSPQSEV